jgi:hypothetical protein
MGATDKEEVFTVLITMRRDEKVDTVNEDAFWLSLRIEDARIEDRFPCRIDNVDAVNDPSSSCNVVIGATIKEDSCAVDVRMLHT